MKKDVKILRSGRKMGSSKMFNFQLEPVAKLPGDEDDEFEDEDVPPDEDHDEQCVVMEAGGDKDQAIFLLKEKCDSAGQSRKPPGKHPEEVVYILQEDGEGEDREEGDDDKSIKVERFSDKVDEEEESDAENCAENQDTMVYVLDGEKVVLLGKHFLVDEDDPPPEDSEQEMQHQRSEQDRIKKDYNNISPSDGRLRGTNYDELMLVDGVASMKKGVKRKREVLLKNSEDGRSGGEIRKGHQVVSTREVQLFSRDQLVQVPYCPDYHAEEVVLADSQEKQTGRRRRKLKGGGGGAAGRLVRTQPISIRPKVDETVTTSSALGHSNITLQPHLLEPLVTGNSAPLVYTVPNSSSSQNGTRQTIILAASPTKSLTSSSKPIPDLKPLPKLRMKPVSSPGVPVVQPRQITSISSPTILSSDTISSGGYGIKVLKNVDVVIKTEPVSHPPSPKVSHPAFIKDSSTTAGIRPGVAAMKIAIPKNRGTEIPKIEGNNVKSSPLHSSQGLRVIRAQGDRNRHQQLATDRKSALIQKKLDSMLPISPSVPPGSSTEDIRMEASATWEAISKDLERCNYPKLKSYVMEKHRWLWQFMKELFDRGDRCLEWKNVHLGIFSVNDMERLGQLWENYKIMTNQEAKAQCWRQLRYYFGLQDENRIIRQIPIGGGKILFQFQTLFYKDRFRKYTYRSCKDFSALEKDIPNISSVIKPITPGIPALFCSRGCGSQFRKSEALQRHEGVCTFSSNNSTA